MTSQPHYSLTWHQYHASMCSNFSTLQQRGDFVDLTLAADGHLVKVHQLILGVASPYIKELIQSAPCKHPVIFLNKVSYSTLCSLLQYVYTGEVAIAEENLSTFFEAAKALHIQGLDGMDTDTELVNNPSLNIRTKTVKAEAAPQTFQIEVIGDPLNPEQVKDLNISNTVRIATTPEKFPVMIRKRPSTLKKSNDAVKKLSMPSSELADTSFPDSDGDDYSGDQSKAGNTGVGSNSAQQFQLTNVVENSGPAYTKSLELQYTVSNRGSLQLILNRYMYNLFCKSGGGEIRRWRCVDYRDHKCPACAVTEKNVVIKRTNLHNHPYHDKKIMAKIEKKAVFLEIKAVDGVDHGLNT